LLFFLQQDTTLVIMYSDLDIGLSDLL
jgi:hypothetical protein